MHKQNVFTMSGLQKVLFGLIIQVKPFQTNHWVLRFQIVNTHNVIRNSNWVQNNAK